MNFGNIIKEAVVSVGMAAAPESAEVPNRAHQYECLIPDHAEEGEYRAVFDAGYNLIEGDASIPEGGTLLGGSLYTLPESVITGEFEAANYGDQWHGLSGMSPTMSSVNDLNNVIDEHTKAKEAIEAAHETYIPEQFGCNFTSG